MPKYPAIKFREPEPLQDYYRDREGFLYSVAKLVDDTRNLKPFKCPLASLDLSAHIWDDQNIIDLAFHCKRVNEADLSKPIIIAWDGVIADGRHRIIKALSNGEKHIMAVRMTWKPAPCSKAEK